MIHLYKLGQTLCGFKMLDQPIFSEPLPRTDTWVGVEQMRDAPIERRCQHCCAHWAAGTMQPTYMRPMHTAPLDKVILLSHYKYLFSRSKSRQDPLSSGWERVGPVWTQVRWIPADDRWNGGDRWEEWCGDEKTRSTSSIRPGDCLGWLPTPGDDS